MEMVSSLICVLIFSYCWFLCGCSCIAIFSIPVQRLPSPSLWVRWHILVDLQYVNELLGQQSYKITQDFVRSCKKRQKLAMCENDLLQDDATNCRKRKVKILQAFALSCISGFVLMFSGNTVCKSLTGMMAMIVFCCSGSACWSRYCECCGPLSLAGIASALVASAVVVSWILTAHWALMDGTQQSFHSISCLSPTDCHCCVALGYGVCVCMIAYVRVSSLKVSTVLLCGLLLYDVFWVSILLRVSNHC